MSIFDFRYLINKYGQNTGDIIHKHHVGQTVDMDNGGKVVDKWETRKIKGVIAYGKGEIAYDEGGFRKERSLTLYCYYKLKDGDIIINKGNQYTVFLSHDRSDFDTHGEGLHIYKLRGDDI